MLLSIPCFVFVDEESEVVRGWVAGPAYSAGEGRKITRIQSLGSHLSPLSTLLLSWMREKKDLEEKTAKLFMCVSFPLVALREWRRLCCRVKGEVAFPETFVPGNRQFQHPQIWAPGEAQIEIQRGIK